MNNELAIKKRIRDIAYSQRIEKDILFKLRRLNFNKDLDDAEQLLHEMIILNMGQKAIVQDIERMISLK